MQSDYQLNLLESYLMKSKFLVDMKSKNQFDFAFLTQKSDVSSLQNEEQDNSYESMLPLGMNMGQVIFEENKESSGQNNNSGSYLENCSMAQLGSMHNEEYESEEEVSSDNDEVELSTLPDTLRKQLSQSFDFKSYINN